MSLLLKSLLKDINVNLKTKIQNRVRLAIRYCDIKNYFVWNQQKPTDD